MASRERRYCSIGSSTPSHFHSPLFFSPSCVASVSVATVGVKEGCWAQKGREAAWRRVTEREREREKARKRLLRLWGPLDADKAEQKE